MNISARETAVLNIGAMAGNTNDPELAKECIDALGAILTSEKEHHTTRVAAARALGNTRSPLALDYLEKVLMASDYDKENKYMTNVRAEAVRALDLIVLPLINLTDRESAEAVKRIRAILQYVEETDVYNPQRIAREILRKAKWSY